MGELTSKLVQKARQFFESYYERGDSEAVIRFLDEDCVLWLGADAAFGSAGGDEAEQRLRFRCDSLRNMKFRIVEHECNVVFRNEACAVVLSRLRMGTGDGTHDALGRLVTLVFVCRGEGNWRIAHVHSSDPGALAADPVAGESGPDRPAIGDILALDRVYGERRRYEIVAELSDDVIYEYDVRCDFLLIFSARLAGRSQDGRNKICFERCLDTVDPASFVHPEDLKRYGENSRSLFEEGAPADGSDGTYSFDCRLRPSFLFPNEGPEYAHCRVTGRRIFDSNGALVKLMGKVVDISEELELMERSTTDALTGAYNRAYLQAKLAEYRRVKQPDVQFACLLMDIDYFKSVNDRFGHPVGDDLLVVAVEIVRSMFRDADVVARLGGDEFMVFMQDLHDPSIVGEKAAALRARFCEIAEERGFPKGLRLSFSFGIVIQAEVSSFSDLYHKADIALYHAKAAGRNRMVFYEPGMVYPEHTVEGNLAE